jgi:Mitochondrial carrier protein
MQVFAASPVAVYSGVGNAFTRISSTEGMRALWRGVSSVVLGAGPAHAVHFGTLEAVKELAGGNEAGNQWVATCKLPSPVLNELSCCFLASCSIGWCFGNYCK